jgi:hypothetical protein
MAATKSIARKATTSTTQPSVAKISRTSPRLPHIPAEEDRAFDTMFQPCNVIPPDSDARVWEMYQYIRRTIKHPSRRWDAIFNLNSIKVRLRVEFDKASA